MDHGGSHLDKYVLQREFEERKCEIKVVVEATRKSRRSKTEHDQDWDC